MSCSVYHAKKNQYEIRNTKLGEYRSSSKRLIQFISKTKNKQIHPLDNFVSSTKIIDSLKS